MPGPLPPLPPGWAFSGGAPMLPPGFNPNAGGGSYGPQWGQPGGGYQPPMQQINGGGLQAPGMQMSGGPPMIPPGGFPQMGGGQYGGFNGRNDPRNYSDGSVQFDPSLPVSIGPPVMPPGGFPQMGSGQYGGQGGGSTQLPDGRWVTPSGIITAENGSRDHQGVATRGPNGEWVAPPRGTGTAAQWGQQRPGSSGGAGGMQQAAWGTDGRGNYSPPGSEQVGSRAQAALAEQLRQQIPWLRDAPDQSPDSIVGAAQAYAQANPNTPVAGILGAAGNAFGNPNAPTAPNRGAKPATARQQVNGDYAAMSQGPAQTGSRSFPGMRDGYPTSNAQAPQGQPPAQPQQPDRSMRPVSGYDQYRADQVRREQQRLGVGPYAPPAPPQEPPPDTQDTPQRPDLVRPRPPSLPPPPPGGFLGGGRTARPGGNGGGMTETPPIVPQNPQAAKVDKLATAKPVATQTPPIVPPKNDKFARKQQKPGQYNTGRKI